MIRERCASLMENGMFSMRASKRRRAPWTRTGFFFFLGSSVFLATSKSSSNQTLLFTTSFFA